MQPHQTSDEELPLTPREVETIDMLDDILSQEQVDVADVRRVSSDRGLVTSALRTRVWPLLLDVDLSNQPTAAEYTYLSAKENKYRGIIAADVHRSLFHFYDASQEAQRMQQRLKLERILNAVISYHEGAVHYYQGLHDIASILLLTLGESLAFALLCRLTGIRLRDCTQSTLDPVAELLKLQVPLLRKLDPALARHLENMDIPCYFAISWFITWFSHDVPQFHEICRLFDFFLASHPMMPLYIGAIGMTAVRTHLLEEMEMTEVHKALVNLRVVRFLTTDELILKAHNLFRRYPPMRIVRDLPFRLCHCVTPFASLENNQWMVPSQTPSYLLRNPGRWFLHTLMGGVMTSNGVTGASIRAVSMAGFGICAVAVVALKLFEHDLENVQKTLWDGMFPPL